MDTVSDVGIDCNTVSYCVSDTVSDIVSDTDLDTDLDSALDCVRDCVRDCVLDTELKSVKEMDELIHQLHSFNNMHDSIIERLYTVQSTITDSILLNGVDLDDILEEAFQNAARIVEESGENHFTKLLLAKL